MAEIVWSDKAKETFDKVVGNLPQFHRSIAEKLVKESAEEIAVNRKADKVELNDLVEAFFKEVPPAFKEMMKRLLTHQGVDYSSHIKE